MGVCVGVGVCGCGVGVVVVVGGCEVALWMQIYN